MAESEFFDRIWFRVSSTGTADFSGIAAIPGYRTPSGAPPSGAGLLDGTLVSYTATSDDELQWECGQGVYSAGVTVRTTIRDSSTGGKVNFINPPRIRYDLLAADLTAVSGVGIDFSTTAKVGDSRLNYHVNGGVLSTPTGPVTAPDDTFNLPDNSSVRVGVSPAGVWQASSISWNPGGEFIYPAQLVTTSGGVITAIDDLRPFANVFNLTGGGAGVAITGGTGITVSPNPITNSGIINNAGVLSLVAGSGISVSGSTGNVTVTATGGGGGGSGLPNALALDSTIIPTNTTGTWVAAQGILNAINPAFGSIAGIGARAVIQAAIDYGWANSIMRVRIPGGRATNYALDGPLFVDMPANLRAGLTLAQQKLGLTAAPSIFFDRGMTIEVDPGVTFSATGAWDTAPFIWIGTHNRCQWIGGSLLGPINPSGSYPAGYSRNHPTACIGISIASGNGGAIATNLINVDIKNFYSGIAWGANGQNALAEGTQVLNCRVNQCYNCYKWYNGQSFPNWFKNCTNSASGVIFANNGQDLIVEGGEIGNFEGFAGVNTLGVQWTAVSALIPFTDGVVGSGFTFTNYKIQYTFVPAADPNLQACPDLGFVYYAAVLFLPSFGLIPLEQLAYDLTTHIGTWRICPEWTWMYYTGGGIALDTDTDFNTELAASTVFHMSTRCVLSTGTIRIKDTHWEFESGVFALKDEMMTGSPNNPLSVFDSLKFGHAIVGDSVETAKDWVSRSWGWIRQGLAPIEFRNMGNQQSGPISKSPVIVGNTIQNNINTNSMIFRGGMNAPLNPTLRLFGQTGNPPTAGVIGYDNTLASLSHLGSKAGGFGWWERNPFSPFIQTNADFSFYLKTAGGTSNISYTGFRPSPNELQRLTTADALALETSSTHVPLSGGMLAVISDLGTPSAAFVIDKGGPFHTWQTTLTITWNCKGGSHYVNITGGGSRNYLFAGLVIVLTTDVTLPYVITGVDFNGTNITGVMVHRLDNTNANISGVKTTTYTNTTIAQRARVLSYPGQTRTARVTTQFNKTSSTALANITGLTLNVFAGLSYRIRACLFTTSNVAGGVQAAIGGTATATAIIYEGQATDAGVVTTGRTTTLGNPVAAVTAVTAARIDISGEITVNASGTLTIQFAQNASNAAASSVLVGSFMEIVEIA